MSSPKKGDKNYKDYLKYQWKYKQSKTKSFEVILRKDTEADLIYSLQNFEGNRSEWFRRIIREAMVRENLMKKAPEADTE